MYRYFVFPGVVTGEGKRIYFWWVSALCKVSYERRFFYFFSFHFFFGRVTFRKVWMNGSVLQGSKKTLMKPSRSRHRDIRRKSPIRGRNLTGLRTVGWCGWWECRFWCRYGKIDMAVSVRWWCNMLCKIFSFAWFWYWFLKLDEDDARRDRLILRLKRRAGNLDNGFSLGLIRLVGFICQFTMDLGEYFWSPIYIFLLVKNAVLCSPEQLCCYRTLWTFLYNGCITKWGYYNRTSFSL